MTTDTDAMPDEEQSTADGGAHTIAVKTEPLPPNDDKLHAWFVEQQTKSVDNLEAAARQIITLCTTLLAVLLGLLSLAKDPLPVYLDDVAVRLVAGLAVLALFVALATALSVVFPRSTPVVINDPDSLQKAFERLLQRKQGALQAAGIFFGMAIFCLALVIGAALFLTAPIDVEVCRTVAAPWWCGLRDLF